MPNSYEGLRDRFLDYVPDDMDKREGTLVYILASALAMATREMYDYIDEMGTHCFIDSSTGNSLERLCKIAGIERRDKTKAVVRIEGGEGLSVGDVVSGEDIDYTIVSANEGYFVAEANQSGTVGNSYTGEVVCVNRADIEDEIMIVSIIAMGEDAEDDESLRSRFIERAKCPVCPGNVSYYKELVDKISGIGGRRIIPSHEGAGTVKVVITDTEYNVATDDLVSYVKELLDPTETEGLGYGLVPLGHKVTVESVEKVDVEIVVDITGVTTDAYYLRLARSKLPLIFKDINKTWDKAERIVLWDRVIEDCFMQLGVNDVNVVSINGGTNRLILEPNQILGDVTINGV